MSFVREGEAAETIADMQYHRFEAVYLRGALYVHCRNGSVMRYTSMHSLLEHKYDMNVLFRSSFSVYKMYFITYFFFLVLKYAIVLVFHIQKRAAIVEDKLK